MNSFRQAQSLLVMAICSLQFYTPALAQATVLTGKVATVDSAPPVFQRQGQYDNGPGYAGTTFVNTSHANAYNANANYTNSNYANPNYANTTLHGSGERNFHPQRPLIRTVYVKDNRTFFQRHPKVKAVSIGAGVGAGAGALTGLVTGRGVVRGALIGGGAGAGVGLVRSSDTLRRHPIVRDVATGSLVGLGLGAAGGRRPGTALKATGVGAAIGLGVGLFKNLR